MVDRGSTNVHLFIIWHLGAITTKSSSIFLYTAVPPWLNCTHTSLCHTRQICPERPSVFSSHAAGKKCFLFKSTSTHNHLTSQWVERQRLKSLLLVNKCNMYRPTQMPLSSHSTSAEIRVAWHHKKKNFQPKLWNTPHRFDSVNTYIKCLPDLSKAQWRKIILPKHAHTWKDPSAHTHILDPWTYVVI